MRKRLFLCFLSVFFLIPQATASNQVLEWVEFNVDYSALEAALALDIASQDGENPLRWTDLLALAAVRCGDSNITPQAITNAAEALQGKSSPQKLLGSQYKYFAYYQRAYEGVLGGLVGSYAIAHTDPATGQTEWIATYGLKAFSPIAAGYNYSHYPDFGSKRSYGFSRPHLGNDLMGTLGTPIVAVESGTVEALGWNQYGGWRIGIRTDDNLRYYYYAHLRKDTPYAPGLEEGQHVNAGDVIGFMGRTGYSLQENVNNIDTVHLHLGLQLIFEERQKECDSEIWVDVYHIVRLLNSHRSSVVYNRETDRWERLYPYRDLDTP